VTQRKDKWLLRTPSVDGVARLFVFPYSGTGASIFRRWPTRVGKLEVCPVQLPGRENRIGQPPFTDFETFAREAAAGLREYLDRPYAIFGHCMGALLAHALTVRLAELDSLQPERLFVSSARVPHLPPERRYRLPAPGRVGVYHPSMSDDELLDEVKHVSVVAGGGDVPPELVPLALQVLRADVSMCFGYVLPEPHWVSCPITAIGWLDDDDVAPEEMIAWEDYGAVDHHHLPGGKLAYLGAPPGLLTAIAGDFETVAGA
jgi:surfactin synthase thioesterase subunit